jgi:hypothetical protein
VKRLSIIKGQQIGAVEFVVLEVEGTTGLESEAKGG